VTVRRSASSLGSLHLFYKADVVVFCEGGHAGTTDEALSTSTDGLTLDTIFWSTMVRHRTPTATYHFKSVGNKDTLKSIAVDVERKGITTVTVCLDSDYDHILGGALSFRRVAYTYGYSWENDVISPIVIQKILSCLIGPVPPNVASDLLAALAQLENDIAPSCEIDIALRAKKKSAIFNREKPLSCADLTKLPPCLNQAALKKQLQACGYVRRPKRVVSVTASTSMRIAFGKLISQLAYHIVIKFAKRCFPKILMSYSVFVTNAIAHTFSFVGLGQLPDLAKHYSAQLSAF
jgi:hypothetical protein